MALFLAVLGGAAVVEVHRAITGGGNKDLHALKLREETLRRQLEEIQKELQQAKSQRELTEQEAVQLAAINAQLQRAKEELDQRTAALQSENDELIERAERLAERQQLLEQCAESLKLENGILMQQFERLKLKHEEEASTFQEQLNALKERVGTLLQQFTEGAITAAQLTDALGEVGVELRCSNEQLAEVPQRLLAATSTEERTQALETVQLEVNSSWLSQMKLITSSPNRAARFMAAPRKQVNLVAAQAEQQIETPRTIEAAALKLSSHAVREEANQSPEVDTIPAMLADAQDVEPVMGHNKEKEGEEEQREATQGRSLLFRAMKRASANQVEKQKQPLEEVKMDLALPLNLQEAEDGMSGSALMVA